MYTIKDLVSVIIPTFNRAGLIARSAKSVLNQTYNNLELIIVDDGSTDNTEEVVKTLDDERVIYIKQTNQGACAARNNGIDHAKGEFIAFQDSDDVWHEDKLEKQIKCLRETGADICFGSMYQIANQNGRFIVGNYFSEGFIPSSASMLGIGTQSLCAKSFVFKEEKFDIAVPRLQDCEVLVRIQKKYRIYYLNEPLVDYYIQGDSISSNPAKLVLACKMILNKHKDLCVETRKSLSNLLLREGFHTKNSDRQLNLFNLAYEIHPSWKTKIRMIAYRLGIYSLYKKVKQ